MKTKNLVQPYTLQTVNVIEIDYPSVVKLVPFPDNESGNKDAIKLFKQMVLEYHTLNEIPAPDSKTMATYVNDAMFLVENDGNNTVDYSIQLVHSDL